MQAFLGSSILAILVVGVILSMDAAELSARDVDRQETYVGAAYAAEAAVQKQLAAAKTSDVDAAGKVSAIAGGAAGADAAYGTVNMGADAGYFDAKFSTSPTTDLDLGDVPGGDVTVKAVRPEDWFNRVAIDYNVGSSEDAQVSVVRSVRSTGERCGFEAYASGACADHVKFVVNTADAARNGVPERGFAATYGAGQNGFADRVTIDGFDPDNWDYRISFSTLSGRPARWSYRAYANGVEKRLANNVVELDAIGTAIDQYSRTKVQKRVSDEMQPVSKYVLFSDGEIAK